jgi:hypothetical protein
MSPRVTMRARGPIVANLRRVSLTIVRVTGRLDSGQRALVYPVWRATTEASAVVRDQAGIHTSMVHFTP